MNIYRRVEQLAARLAHNQDVAGSSPASSTQFAKDGINREESNGAPLTPKMHLLQTFLPPPARYVGNLQASLLRATHSPTLPPPW